ncbi:MFS general substrate transporter [Pyrenophora tritici-repentis]|nr:MFS general substrate transporter [Pyrenophora tritici-repentis]
MTAMKDQRRAAEAAIFDQTNLLPPRKVFVTVGALAICQLICYAEQTGIGIALPAIGRDLNAQDTISWAGTSALISNTIFQVLYGRLSDLFGRKPTLLWALALLAISDLLCGFAKNDVMLYVFRGFSGVANGGVASLSAMIVSDVVTLEQRGKWQGIIGAAVGMGNIVGPFVAAAFVQGGSWRGFFWSFSPAAVASGLLCLWLLPTSKDRPKVEFKQVMKKIDFGGIFFGSVALILLLIPIAGGGDYFDWDSPKVIAMLTIGSICSLLFIYVERSVALLPMMPLSLFKNTPVAVMLAQNFLFGIVAYSQTFYLPLFFQNAQRLSPMKSACLMLPLTSFQATSSILSGQYISRQGRYGEIIWLGFFLWTLGSGLTCIFGVNTPMYVIVLILMVTGIGIGMVFQPVLIALQAHCTRAQRAIVISNRNFIRSLGGAVGLAISAAVLQNSLYQALPKNYREDLSAYETPNFAKLGEEETTQIVQAYAKASRTVFYMNVSFIALCLIGCFLIKDRGLQRPDEVNMDEEKKVERSDSGSEQVVVNPVEDTEKKNAPAGGRRMSGATL